MSRRLARLLAWAAQVSQSHAAQSIDLIPDMIQFYLIPYISEFLRANETGGYCEDVPRAISRGLGRDTHRVSSDDAIQKTSARYRAVEPEKWLQRHPAVGSSWPWGFHGHDDRRGASFGAAI